MSGSIRLGRVLAGIAMIALGAIGVAYADFILEWTPAPAAFPGRVLCTYLHGGLLVVTGFGLLFDKTARFAALALTAVWFLWTLLHIPLVLANWRAGLGGQFETLAMTSGFLVLAGALSPPEQQRTLVLIGRYGFAVSMPMFGVVHFLYPAAVADFIPAWMPGRLFWAYFTGVAHFAAGLAILAGVLAVLASRMFAIMLSSWVLILHIPRVAARLHDRHEWYTLFIALALAGLAWVLAGSLAGHLRSKREADPA